MGKYVAFTKIPHSLYENQMNEWNDLFIMKMSTKKMREKIIGKTTRWIAFLFPRLRCGEQAVFQSLRGPKTSRTIPTWDEGLI